jgi:hypothetical protein
MEKKMTKKEMFNLIKTALADNELVVEFCDHEIELLEKKASNGKAKANETMDKSVELVYKALAEYGKQATATELIANTDLSEIANEMGVVTPQKVSSYLNKLVASGKVEKTTDKKKTYFSIVG